MKRILATGFLLCVLFQGTVAAQTVTVVGMGQAGNILLFDGFIK